MDLKKFSIIFSSSDIAGKNIAEKIAEVGYKEAIHQIDDSVLYAKFKDRSGPYIVLSRHSSEKKIRALTCHFTGNWTDEAKYGGNPREVCIAMPSVMKGVAQYIASKIDVLEGYVFTLEVTHHGPTGDFPMMFVEIGSSKEDWSNTKAANVIADALLNANEVYDGDVVMGVGGPHYAPDFTRLLNRYRIAHIVPQYAVDELNFETFKKGIEKSTEPVEKVLIAWKGLTAPQREKIIKYCDEYGIDYIKYK